MSKNTWKRCGRETCIEFNAQAKNHCMKQGLIKECVDYIEDGRLPTDLELVIQDLRKDIEMAKVLEIRTNRMMGLPDHHHKGEQTVPVRWDQLRMLCDEVERLQM